MNKLRQRLEDAARSGVYRATRAEAIADALQGSGLALARVDLGKPVFDAFSEALAFPDWFGRNWDALEDCLTDLSWLEAAGHVLILHGGAASPTLLDVLDAAAQFWRAQGRPFFAVLLDAPRSSGLPDLYRET